MDHISPSWCHVVANQHPSATDPPVAEPTCEHPHTFKIRNTISIYNLKESEIDPQASYYLCLPILHQWSISMKV